MSTRINLVGADHGSSHEAGGSDVFNDGSTLLSSQVRTGALPTVWTDLDVSSIVGAQSRFVVLQIECTDLATINLSFRTKGSTDDFFWNSADAGTLNQGQIGAAKFGYMMCITDSNGILQVIAANTRTCNIKVAGWF